MSKHVAERRSDSHGLSASAGTGPLLVCGGGGFLGSHCTSWFASNGWAVTGLGRGPRPEQAWTHAKIPYVQCDLTDVTLLSHLRDIRPEQLVYAAGPADVQASFAQPVLDFENQLLPLLRLLDAVRRLPRPPRVLLVSSAAVYGNPQSLPVSESTPSQPISPYGFHKLQQESLLDEYAALYGLRTCSARVFSSYGPGLRRLAVWDIARRALQGDSMLLGTGAESRDYLHAADVARALDVILQGSPFEGERVNVASGTETSIAELAGAIHKHLGLTSQPAFSGHAELGKPVRWRADTTRLRDIGFVPSIRLDEGLRQTVQWVRSHV